MKRNKRKKLVDLEENIRRATPIGRPRLFNISVREAGVDYTVYGLSNEEKEKVYYSFLQKITKDSPIEANSFSCSEIDLTDCTYWLDANIAVQYYKSGETK